MMSRASASSASWRASGSRRGAIRASPRTGNAATIRRSCTRLAAPYPHARAHLTALRERGHPLAVVTNKPERFAVAVVAQHRLADLFGAVAGGDTLPQKKPDPAPLRHALAQLGAPVAGSVKVGDGLQDLQAAQRLGLGTIACLFGYGDPAALRAEGADRYWTAFGREH